MVPQPNTLVLLSGGIDSAACLSFFVDRGDLCTTLFADYGQPSAPEELVAARAISRYYAVPLRTLVLHGAAPKSPGMIRSRNAYLLTTALMEASPTDSLISIGIHASTTYSDCTAAFVLQMQTLFDLYVGGTVQLAAPFVNWTRSQIIAYCHERRVPLHLTYSCESGESTPCGHCPSCRDRKGVLARA
jgi:7-cyano-7-deazaguanine synthase